VTLTFLKRERAIAFLKSEKAIDGLRWGAAFVAVVLAYGVAAWMLLRPTGWQLGVNGPIVEINLSDLPQPSAIPPSDRASEPASPANPLGANAASDRPASSDDQQNRTAERAAGGAAGRTNADAAARNATDAKDGPADAGKTAALEPADKIAQPASPADAAPAALPKTEAPAADSGRGGRPTAAPPRVVTPDNSTAPSATRAPIDTSTAANAARAPIDTSITVNQGRGPLRSARGGPVFRGASTPQLRLTLPTLPVATPRDSSGPFSRKLSPTAGSTLPVPGPAAANHGHSEDPAQKPAIGIGGGVARNAIGVVIEQHAVVPHAGAPLGIQAPPGVTSTTVHASGEHGPATSAVGVPLTASNLRPSDPGPSPGVPNRVQVGHPDQALHASQIASAGGPAINGAGLSRPASSTGAVGGPKATAGALNGSSFRSKYP